jgi:hypothetical protein
MKKEVALFITLFLLFTAGQVWSQDEKEMVEMEEGKEKLESNEEALAKKSANPIANMISVPMQLNINFGVGEYNRSSLALNFMPVLPFKFFNWNVINRIILPVISRPDDTETGSYSGIGNINYSMLFVPPPKGIFQYGFGPAFNIPTLSNPEIGRDVFSMGPAIIALLMPGKWVMGFTANQTWSYYPGKPYSTLFLQYFVTYNIKKGWYVNTNPIVTADWTAPEGEQWLVPVGAGGGKVFHAGKQAMRLQAQGYYNVVAPTGSGEWTLQIMYVLLFPR